MGIPRGEMMAEPQDGPSVAELERHLERAETLVNKLAQRVGQLTAENDLLQVDLDAAQQELHTLREAFESCVCREHRA